MSAWVEIRDDAGRVYLRDRAAYVLAVFHDSRFMPESVFATIAQPRSPQGWATYWAVKACMERSRIPLRMDPQP